MSLLALLAVACGDGPQDSAGALQSRCSSCHVEQAMRHSVSRHAQAARSEVFVALRARAQQAWSAATFCDGCHRPVGGTDDGLGCLTCHASTGNLGRGDGALLLSPDGPVQAGLPSGRAPHSVGGTGFISSADLCGTCHEVQGPGPFRESPFTHWQKSPAGQRNQPCQSCHMPKDGRRVTEHRPRGLLAGADDEVQQWLAEAVDLELRREADDRVVVRITSRLQGHMLPDGASFLRALWLDVRADGAVLDGRRWLSARLFRGAQEVVLPTEADRAESRGLLPGASREERFAVPAGRAITACLRFQRYRPDLLAALGLSLSLAGPEILVRCTPAPE